MSLKNWTRWLNKAWNSEVFLAVTALSITILVVFFSYFKNPGKLLPAAGDGMKNYFTYLYHIKFDSTFWKFEGMNYPFGENIIFTDNQPFFVNIVKLFYGIYPFSDEVLIAIHNYTIFLGLMLGGLGIYLCLRKLYVSTVIAIFASIGLMLLQPQMLRIHSHFSMVFPFLPWIYLIWLKIWAKPKYIQYSLIICVFSTIAGLIHMYHFLTISFLCILALFFSFVLFQPATKWVVAAKMLLIQVVIPFSILFVMSNYIHHIQDRPSNPWGFFSYTATWESMFFSYKLPLFEFIDRNIITIRAISHDEGKNYLGIVSVLFCLVCLFGFLSQIKTKYPQASPTHSIQATLIWIGISSALLSFGLPFIIPGLEGLLDYSGPFQQFRGIGRLGWISFYAFNYVAIPSVFKWIGNIDNKVKKVCLSSVCLVIIIGEGYFKIPDMTNPPQLVDAYSDKYPTPPINLSEYQAILPDPYLHIGSECFGWEDVGGNQDQNFQLGYKTGLPNLGVVMSRNSLSQALMMNELVCKPYKVPDIILTLRQKDTRPLLVFESKLNLYHRESGLGHWTKDAPIVFENDEFILRKMNLFSFDTISKNYTAQIATDKNLWQGKIINISFDKMEKDDAWGYESIVKIDSTIVGDWSIEYTVTCKTNSDVNAILETWQFNAQHYLLENNSVRSNRYYTNIDGNKLKVNVPIRLQKETSKLSIRLSKYRQKEGDEIVIEHPVLVRRIKGFEQILE